MTMIAEKGSERVQKGFRRGSELLGKREVSRTFEEELAYKRLRFYTIRVIKICRRRRRVKDL